MGLGKSIKERQIVIAFRVLPTKTVTIPPGDDEIERWNRKIGQGEYHRVRI